MGVMKAVGEAVQEGQSYNYTHLGMTHSLRCIGIAPWGYIEGNQNLVSKDSKVCYCVKFLKTWLNVMHKSFSFLEIQCSVITWAIF